MPKLTFAALISATIVLVPYSAQATLVFDGTPTGPNGIQASSQFNGSFGPANLFDGSITPADIGTANNLGNQYATNGGVTVDPVVSMDFGSPITASSIVYSQRLGGTAGADNVGEIKVWFTSSFFTPSGNSLPAGSPNEDITVTDLTDNLLTQYAFAHGSHTSQYVTLELIGAPGAANPGGSELRFAQVVPEPASLICLGLGALGLFIAARRVRRS